jgi:ubiquinone/menaquinone biosynthesis C-methylase UbiE
MSRLPDPYAFGQSSASADAQNATNTYFDEHVTFWDDVYRSPDVFALIHQQRRQRALALIDGLGLTPGSRVLEIGCGAGLLAVALAAQGFQVDATDASPGMVQATKQRAREHGLDGVLRCRVADVHQLVHVPTGRYRLVVALGVVPWLHAPPVAVREMGRVLEDGGHLIINADNRHRLIYLLDPRVNPTLEPARAALRSRLPRSGRPPADEAVVRPGLHSLAEFDRLLSDSGLHKVSGSVLGFGPFTLNGRFALPTKAGIRLHLALQRAADNGVPVLRSLGSQYLVLARKPVKHEHSGDLLPKDHHSGDVL